jgi:hypothetical protein
VVFAMSPAKLLLREDIKKKVAYKTPKDLQKSRVEYKPFKPDVFKYRIRQEIKLGKYLYYLKVSREQLRTEGAKKPRTEGAKKPRAKEP